MDAPFFSTDNMVLVVTLIAFVAVLFCVVIDAVIDWWLGE